jgi:hypothetical protein
MNVTYNHSQCIVPDVTANTYLELGIRPGDCLFITQSNLQQTIDVKKLAGDGSAPIRVDKVIDFLGGINIITPSRIVDILQVRATTTPDSCSNLFP